jgi:hypothetical protein
MGADIDSTTDVLCVLHYKLVMLQYAIELQIRHASPEDSMDSEQSHLLGPLCLQPTLVREERGPGTKIAGFFLQVAFRHGY